MAKAYDLPKVLKNIESNTILKLERQTALEFHKLINQYRKQNKLDTIAWNDILWLTAQNHNYYMVTKDVLAHEEIKGEKYFTGIDPGDRVDFVTEKKGNLRWSGENCLMRWGTSYREVTDLTQTAKDLAFACIEQWKKSPGHNANMLGVSHKSHGFAVILKDNLVYATDLFSYDDSYFPINNIENPGNSNSIIDNNVVPKKQPIVVDSHIEKISISKITKDLKKKLPERIFNENKKITLIKPFENAAQYHLSYLQANNTLSSSEVKGNKLFYGTTPSKRVGKASYGFWHFLKPKFNSIVESVALVEISEDEYNVDEVVEQLWEQLITDNALSLSDFSSFGLAVKTKKTKEGLKIYAVLLLNP
ncbi:MAG: CAP domain-containing protein [Bacteroidetes bacterium]|nr:CAP domain-containing protein [Bacteroidota bacterium]